MISSAHYCRAGELCQEVCQFSKLRIFDVSSNNLNGNVTKSVLFLQSYVDEFDIRLYS